MKLNALQLSYREKLLGRCSALWRGFVCVGRLWFSPLLAGDLLAVLMRSFSLGIAACLALVSVRDFTVVLRNWYVWVKGN